LVNSSCRLRAAKIAGQEDYLSRLRDFSHPGRRAIWDGLQVHHRIPLEWQHLMPGEATVLQILSE
jgi:hypothetical protein